MKKPLSCMDVFRTSNEKLRKTLAFAVFFLLPILGYSANLKGNWGLEKSEITYTVTHPFHVVHGKSLSARGEGVCYEDGICRFLVAVQVKSFDSGDNNRDLHMQEVTRAGLNPLIKVTVEMAQRGELKASQQLAADAEIGFAGKKAKYPKLKLNVVELKADEVHITGTIPLTLKDFEIQPPSLLTLPVNNEVPIKLDMWWKRSNGKVVPKKK
ncbi:MAG TPA: YceI family protein [bacterium]